MGCKAVKGAIAWEWKKKPKNLKKSKCTCLKTHGKKTPELEIKSSTKMYSGKIDQNS